MQVKISKWGNSLGVRVPKDVAEKLGLKDGASAEMAIDKGRIIISTKRPRYSLDELLVGMTPKAMHEAFDWGPDVGREKVD